MPGRWSNCTVTSRRSQVSEHGFSHCFALLLRNHEVLPAELQAGRYWPVPGSLGGLSGRRRCGTQQVHDHRRPGHAGARITQQVASALAARACWLPSSATVADLGTPEKPGGVPSRFCSRSTGIGSSPVRLYSDSQFSLIQQQNAPEGHTTGGSSRSRGR